MKIYHNFTYLNYHKPTSTLLLLALKIKIKQKVKQKIHLFKNHIIFNHKNRKTKHSVFSCYSTKRHYARNHIFRFVFYLYISLSNRSHNIFTDFINNLFSHGREKRGYSESSRDYQKILEISTF